MVKNQIKKVPIKNRPAIGGTFLFYYPYCLQLISGFDFLRSI